MICNHCLKSFTPSRPRKNRNIRFCSISCANKSRCKNYISYCRTCSTQIILHNKAEVNRDGGKYCSHVCSRKYQLNSSYFKKITNQRKAYWLGFISADGFISRHTLGITLSSKDFKHLEKFKKELNYNGPIKTDKRGFVSIYINSKILVTDLIRHGIVPAKSLILKFPTSLPNHLIKHYIRGVFDGDGCIYSCKLANIKNKQFRAWGYSIFSGSHDFAISLYNHLKNAGINAHFRTQSKGFVVSVNKRSEILKWGNFLYSKSNIMLDRKFNKFKEFHKYIHYYKKINRTK